MDKEKYEAELHYQTIMATVRKMLENGIIDETDYTIIDTKMKEKYHPFLGSI